MALDLRLKRKDYAIIGTGFLGVLGFASAMSYFFTDPMGVEMYTRFVMSAVILASVFFIYQAITSWAGDLARYLELIGLGLAIEMIIWMPHIGWHVSGMGPVFGLSPTFILSFFHAIGVLGFLITAYGFYLFWKQA